MSAHERREKDIQSRYQTEILSVVAKWNKAQEKYKEMAKKNKDKAEQFLLSEFPLSFLNLISLNPLHINVGYIRHQHLIFLYGP